MAKPHRNPKRGSYAIKDYKLNKTARRILTEIIKDNKIDIHKPYDLFNITSKLTDYYSQSILEKYGLGTTGEVTMAIEMLKANL
jgi:DNA modification methylase